MDPPPTLMNALTTATDRPSPGRGRPDLLEERDMKEVVLKGVLGEGANSCQFHYKKRNGKPWGYRAKMKGAENTSDLRTGT